MNHSRMRNPRPSLVALAIVLLGAFLVIPSSAAVASDQARQDGIQRFLFLSTDPSGQGTPETVLATGPIHAKGTDVVLSNRKDRLIFPAGTLTLKHKPKASDDSFDPVTCLFRFRERGTYKIIDGTGAYEDASGHGKYRVKGLGVGCEENAPPEIFMLRIVAKGPIHL